MEAKIVQILKCPGCGHTLNTGKPIALIASAYRQCLSCTETFYINPEYKPVIMSRADVMERLPVDYYLKTLFWRVIFRKKIGIDFNNPALLN